MHPLSSGIVHHPLRFQVGHIAISGYGIALVMAFLIAWVVIARENGRRGDDVALAGEIVLAASIGALVGSKLSYAAFIGNGPILTRAGHTFWGGLIGGAGAYWLWARLRRLSFFRYLDVTGISIAAGYGVGRTGCWAVGDDYGRPWSGPLAVAFPEGTPPSTAQNMREVFGAQLPPDTSPLSVVSVHPTQLYETALGFIMFLTLWRFRDHRRAQGWLFGLYCVLAGVERFLIEVVRAKAERLPVGLSVAQVVALAIAAAGMLLIYARRAARDQSPGLDA